MSSNLVSTKVHQVIGHCLILLDPCNLNVKTQQKQIARNGINFTVIFPFELTLWTVLTLFINARCMIILKLVVLLFFKSRK